MAGGRRDTGRAGRGGRPRPLAQPFPGASRAPSPSSPQLNNPSAPPGQNLPRRGQCGQRPTWCVFPWAHREKHMSSSTSDVSGLSKTQVRTATGQRWASRAATGWGVGPPRPRISLSAAPAPHRPVAAPGGQRRRRRAEHQEATCAQEEIRRCVLCRRCRAVPRGPGRLQVR